MFRLRSEAARQHFARHETTIDAGVRQLAESVSIELAETAAGVVPTRLGDNLIRRRVADALRPRIEDLIAGLHAIDQPTARPPAMPTSPNSLAIVGAIGAAALLVLRWLPWGRLLANASGAKDANAIGGDRQSRILAEEAAYLTLKEKAESQGSEELVEAMARYRANWWHTGKREAADADG